MARFRRAALALAGAVALVAATAACGDDDSGRTDPNATVTLSYAVWDKNQVPAMQEIASAFTKQNRNIVVDVQLTPWETYWTKLKAAATGGTAPDVFWMNGPNFQLYATNDVLAPLDTFDTSNYPKALIDLYTVDGKQYGIPKDFDTVGLWYNKALFDAADVTYPDDTWTWETFKAAAAKLTDKAKGQYAIAANLTSAQEYQYNTIYQAGGSVISADGKTSGYADPATVQGLKFWTDLIAAGQSPDLKTMTDTASINLFESGKTAMYYGGSWNAGEFTTNASIKSKVDVAVLPKGVKQATVIHGLANVISAKSAHKEQAWKFVQYLGSRQAAEIESKAGVIPAFNGTQQAWVDRHPELHLQALLDELAYAVPFPVSRNTAAWNELEMTYLTPAWNQREGVSSAANKLATAMNDALAKE
ncbi:sugar ABC transporter substrate-binding protein [Actinoplanes sp. TFC3]|uniref:ABC transporter substrate-binding protein n=1 Tax=Actinoplanes sp. TFC3 TaxID=1710355 RepID=UPI000836402F|nr:sugar ABC transporter substrate-binding protein [Actinoplanes sp. TFC3]